MMRLALLLCACALQTLLSAAVAAKSKTRAGLREEDECPSGASSGRYTYVDRVMHVCSFDIRAWGRGEILS